MNSFGTTKSRHFPIFGLNGARVVRNRSFTKVCPNDEVMMPSLWGNPCSVPSPHFGLSFFSKTRRKNHAWEAAALISSAPSKVVPCRRPNAPATHARATASLDTGGDSATCRGDGGGDTDDVILMQ